MELYWVFGVIAALVILAVAFGLGEGHALRTNQATLSRTIWEINKAWPPFGVCFGALVFGPICFLACHFFWPGEGCSIGPLH